MHPDTHITPGTTGTHNDGRNDQSHNLLQCSLSSHVVEIKMGTSCRTT